MKTRTLIQLIVAGLLFLGAVGAYLAWYATVGKLSASADALSVQIQEKGQDSARIRSAKEALESLVADEEAMRAYLVQQANIVSFLSAIEDTGTGLGSSVEVVSVSAESKGETNSILLSLKITGSFDAVLRTIGAIEYGPYDSSVESVTLDTVAGETAGVWTAAASFSIGTQAPKP